jgi:two-component system nitrate/nitrite response regulator NarL
MSDLRVYILAADPLARGGLAALLSGHPGILLSGQGGGDTELAAELDLYQPEVLLCDLGWDANAMLEHLEDLPSGSPPVLALLPGEDWLSQIWPARARGVLARSASAERLAAALTAVAAGLSVLDPAFLGTLREPRAQDRPELEEELTQREMEVLACLAEGLSNKAIALRLGISEHTVKFHVNTILGKLGAQSRTDAVVRATRLGIIAL